MVSDPHIRPQIAPQHALRIASERFAIPATLAEPLSSDRDQNFILTEEASGRKYVLKLAHAGEDREILDFQNRMLEHLARAGFPLSKVLFAVDGSEIVEIPGPEGKTYLTRLLTWLPGTLFHEVNPQTPALFNSLGAFLGGMDRALEDFTHPAQDRELEWDLKGAGRVVRSHLQFVDDPGRRGLLEEMAERFLERLGPLVPNLRLGVIHADANDYNVVVNRLAKGDDPDNRRVVGLVDFGDALRSYTAGEVAVAAAHTMLGKGDPFTVAAQVVGGYHRAFPLKEEEVSALFPLMGLRLCSRVAISAAQSRPEPGSEGLTVVDQLVWAFLERLESESLDFPTYLIRQACGLDPAPGATAVAGWLKAHGNEAAPVVGPAGVDPLDLRTTPVHVFDLSVESREFGITPEPTDVEGWTDLLFRKMKKVGVEVGVGRYDEVRRWYTSDIFRAPGEGPPEWRTVHLGIDLFLDGGSPVYSPFDAVVHSVANNPGDLDYGPTVILEHRVEGGRESDLRFWTLYGHLAEETLTQVREGRVVAKGEAFAAIGSFPVNGNWAPHLHFQVISDPLGMKGNYPGVGLPSQREIWKILSPDPNLLLAIPLEPGSGVSPTPETGLGVDAILRAREERLGPNLSLAYQQPLKLVRGWRQFMYDPQGQTYLDCISSVSQVGHSHPRVVEAGQRQMALLNTDTRYLHDLIVEYAERLVSTLPDPLSKVYFASTGSEANELALRLARAHTRRKDVLVVEGGYHGHTSTLVDISPYLFDGPGGDGPRSWVHTTLMPDSYQGRFRALAENGGGEDRPPTSSSRGGGADASGTSAEPEFFPTEEIGPRYADHVRQVVGLMKAEGRSPAAFVCESVLGCGGQIILPDGYLSRAYDHVREAGGVCVADEVQVGFGRTGSHFWAFESQDVVPDIVTMGGPMGNGHPVAAVVTTAEIAASFDTGMEYFHAFGGGPVSCAVGMAVLDVLEEERLQENARSVGGHLLARLRELEERHPLVGNVRGRGLCLGVELVEDGGTQPATEKATRVKERLRDHRILVSATGPRENVLAVNPPLVFTRADADRLVDTLDRILGEEEFQR
ncbi:aminotransferase class III-fold pyridoxal phosphate-dependent enzyme [Gemmatimonadota bacterium]